MTKERMTRRAECGNCGADVCFALQDGYDGPDIQCGMCGAAFSDHALAIADAQRRFSSVAEATPVAMRHTYEELMDTARKIYDDPASATEDQLDALAAFRLLRHAGLPCHAPPRLN